MLAPEALADLWHHARIVAPVDVRAFPGSRRHPGFARAAMERCLPAAGVDYRWEPRLGGLRRAAPDSPHLARRDDAFRGYAEHMRRPDFTDGVTRLLEAAGDRPTVVMWAEGGWSHCHRRLPADPVELLHDRPVGHILHSGVVADHEPTDGVRVEGDSLVYDGGQPTLGRL